MKQIRIVVADHHSGIRQGIKVLLEQHPHLRVVAQANTGETAIQQVLTLQPNVVVMDLRIPGQSSEDVCHLILDHLPTTKVIILTTLADDILLPAVLRAGATGYVVKRIQGHDLIDLIAQVS